MNDSLLYHLNVLLVSDTTVINNITLDSNALCKVETISFIQTNSAIINPELLVNNSNFDTFTYIIFLLLGIIGIIWHTTPERLITILTPKSFNKIQRNGDSITKSPGFIILVLFWLIFAISLSIFSILFLNNFYLAEILKIPDSKMLLIIISSFIGLFTYRFILSYATAFIFQTQKLLKLQVIIDRNTQFLTGILLLPISLLIIYTNLGVIFYIVITILVALQVSRIIQIAIIGKSSVVFSTFHIILYLCALEIVPILVLLRLINNDFEM